MYLYGMKDTNDTCLYLHTRKSDGIIFYVGIGDKKRPYTKRGRNFHWLNTVNLYDYEVTVLLENLTWERACEIEIKMISFYGRADLGLGTLVNWTDGGEGAKNPSEEARKKLSDRTKGENNPMFGAYGELNPMYGRCGELHPFFGVERLDHSKKMTGEGNPMYGVGVYDLWVKNYGKEEADKKNEIANEKRRNKLKGNKNGKMIKVICTKTNVVYETISAAAKSVGMSISTLQVWLNNEHRNKTTFRFLQ